MVAEEIKAFKELLDAGAITQEEYDYKKRELLNIPCQQLKPISGQPNDTAICEIETPAYLSCRENAPDNTHQEHAEKSKVAAGLLAIFLGSIGIHKFYLGYTDEGIAMLLITLLGSIVLIGPLAMAIVSFIEGIIYLTRSDAAFYTTYIQNQKVWF